MNISNYSHSCIIHLCLCVNVFTLTAFILISIISCEPINPTGTYVYREYKNDTLFVYPDGTFMQRTYNKNGKLIYNKKTVWKHMEWYSDIEVNSILLWSNLGCNKDTSIDEDIGYSGLTVTDSTISWRDYIDLPETEHYYDKIR